MSKPAATTPAPEGPQRRRLLPHAAVCGGLAERGAGLQQAAGHHHTCNAAHHAAALALPAQQAAQVVDQHLQAQRAALAVAHAQPRHKRHVPAPGGGWGGRDGGDGAEHTWAKGQVWRRHTSPHSQSKHRPQSPSAPAPASLVLAARQRRLGRRPRVHAARDLKVAVWQHVAAHCRNHARHALPHGAGIAAQRDARTLVLQHQPDQGDDGVGSWVGMLGPRGGGEDDAAPKPKRGGCRESQAQAVCTPCCIMLHKTSAAEHDTPLTPNSATPLTCPPAA